MRAAGRAQPVRRSRGRRAWGRTAGTGCARKPGPRGLGAATHARGHLRRRPPLYGRRSRRRRRAARLCGCNFPVPGRGTPAEPGSDPAPLKRAGHTGAPARASPAAAGTRLRLPRAARVPALPRPPREGSGTWRRPRSRCGARTDRRAKAALKLCREGAARSGCRWEPGHLCCV